jgi:probable rRNA maturation factor
MSSSEPSSEPPGSADWFINRQRSVSFDSRALIVFASELRRRLAFGREFAICITSDAAMRAANAQFRGKREVTDVLSFPENEGSELGSVLISAPQARRQAHELGHTVDEELKILLLHALLHLLGYDHERDRGEMMRLELLWRRKLRLPSGLIERANPRQHSKRPRKLAVVSAGRRKPGSGLLRGSRVGRNSKTIPRNNR